MSAEGKKRDSATDVAKRDSQKIFSQLKTARADISKSAPRYSKMVDAAAEKAPPKIVPYLKKAAPVFGVIIAALEVLTPIMIQVGMMVYRFGMALPHNILAMVAGLSLCFFGGLWPMTVSAYEASQVCGGRRMYKALETIYEESEKIIEESKKDDEADDDGDGIADVDQIDAKALLLRKTQLVLKKCDPGHWQTAVGALYSTWIGVVAALRIEYARTIALALSISDMLHRPATKFIAPVLTATVPEEYRKWNPVVLDSACKFIGISLAWILQRILSTIQSAMRGGNLFVNGLIGLLKSKDKLPESFAADDSYLDEIAVYGLAVIGCYFQMFILGYSLPFPFSLMFLPLDTVEFTLKWAVTSGSAPAPPA